MEKCRRQCHAANKEAQKATLDRERATEIANSIRLNLESIYDLPHKIEDVCNEHLKCNLTITQWNVSFTPSMRNTHSCPIGGKQQWSLRNGEKKIHYKGWHGRISGKMDEVKIGCGFSRSFSDLFKDCGSEFHIRGFHTGCGGGGSDSFSYDCDIYLDDYPKLKAKYEEYWELNQKQEAYTEEQMKLIAAAENKFVQQDRQLNHFAAARKILQAKLKDIEKLTLGRQQSIRSSREFQTAVEVSDKFFYDVATYNSLSKIFRTR